MFTGIIEEIGTVKAIEPNQGGVTLVIAADEVLQNTSVGDSIAVDGVCLTVAARRGRVLSFDVMPETWRKTTLHKRRPGHRVHAEQALRVGDRVGGHFVTGHVDGTGAIRSKRLSRGNLEVRVSLPPRLRAFVVDKGSIAVDGISLTVAAVGRGTCSVYLIPLTARVTTLGTKRPGESVNIECDMLLKRPDARPGLAAG